MSVRNTVSFTRLVAVHPLACRAPARLQGHGEIAKHLSCLRGEIILANQIAVVIERGQAGNEDNAAGADVDNLGIAGRCAEFRRIDAGN
jgi:hypothetical protein